MNKIPEDDTFWTHLAWQDTASHGKPWHDMAWHYLTQKELPPTLEQYD
jgi:hypothetical protein